MLTLNTLREMLFDPAAQLFGVRMPHGRKTVSGRRQRPVAAPALVQVLEDRTLLAAIVVDSNDDTVGVDGVVTLREAILSANGNADLNADVTANRTGAYNGDSIVFDTGVFGGGETITLGGTALSITDALEIDGVTGTAGSTDVTISADNLSRIFDINTGGDVVLTGMTLMDGSATDGGAILTNGLGTTTLNQMAIFDSSATSFGGGVAAFGAALVVNDGFISLNMAGESGGGIAVFQAAGSTLEINGTEISDNSAAGAGAQTGGGGILIGFPTTTATIDGATISNNSATGTAGSGGGILTFGASVDISNSTISGNSANRAGGGIEVALGVPGTVTITDSMLEGNTAGPAGTANPGNGGALHISGSGHDVTITGGTVSGNIAAREGGGLWNDAGSTLTVNGGAMVVGNVASGPTSDDGGGGIFNNGGTLNVSDATISGNTAIGAAGSGGGILSTGGTVTVDLATIEDNLAVRAGGGIEVQGGTVDLTNSSLNNNSAGIFSFLLAVSGDGATPSEALFNLNPTTAAAALRQFLGNGDDGETIAFNPDDGLLYHGSGIGTLNDPDGRIFETIDLTTGTITSIPLSGYDSDEWSGLTYMGGGTFLATNIDNELISVTTGGVMTLLGAMDHTSAGIAFAGGTLYSVDRDSDSLLTIDPTDGTTLTTTTITLAGGSVFGGTGLATNPVTGELTALLKVGGLSLTGRALATIDPMTGVATFIGDTGNSFAELAFADPLTDAIANPGNGGGLHSAGGTTVTIDAVDVLGNTAASEGGGLWFGGDATVTNVFVEGNAAIDGGGGIYVQGNGQTVDILGGTVSGNSSNSDGGGIGTGASASTELNIDGTFIDFNLAGTRGGGVFLDVDFVTTITNGTTISSNTASGDAATEGGGGVYNLGGGTSSLTISDSFLLFNLADGDSGSGGGLFTNAGPVTITNTQINLNEAVRAGGGVEIRNGILSITDSVLDSNDVSEDVGLILAQAPGNGGGLHVSGAMANVTIDNTLVTNNVAGLEGGGLWNNAGSTLTVRNNSLIDFNTASGDAADDGGGGIFNNGGGLVVQSGTIISNNSADGTLGSGGGIFSAGGPVTISDTTISGGSANRAGGGIEGTGGQIIVNSSTITGNSAGINGGGTHSTGTVTTIFDNTDVTMNTAAQEGGGLWNSASGIMIIRNGTTVSGNTASGAMADQGGGGIFNDGNGAGGNGGRLSIQSGSTISDNMADGASGSGGGILTINGVVTVDDSVISGNTANRAGGGIEMVTGIVELRNSNLDGNDAGGAAPAPGNGGGLHVSGVMGQVGFVRIFGGTVSGNTAAKEGGGLWNQSGNIMIVRQGAVVDGNTASGDAADDGGGGIFNNGGRLAIAEDVEITNNSADGLLGSGGGVFSLFSGVSIDDTLIAGNTANRAGGGIEVVSGEMNLTNVVLSGNQALGTGMAPGNGGGLHVSGNAFTRIDGGIVVGNTAALEGGGLWNSATGVLLVRRSFTQAGNPSSTRDATGPDAASIQATVDAFRNDLGTLNANEPGTTGFGRRQINWDGAPDSVSAPNAFPGDFFNANVSGRARGVEFSTPGTGFQLSANAASGTAVEFGNINPTYETAFSTFSAERLFTPIGSNTTVVDFFVPGTDLPALVSGFGAVFTDVDVFGSTTIEYFDINGTLIGTRTAQATPGDGGQSFVGLNFNTAKIAQVRITSGNAALGAGVNDITQGGASDLVVMDDFIFSEPVPFGSLVQGNTASGDAADDGGGGIFNDGGRLAIFESLISNNTADGVAGSGGGIFVRQFSTGAVTANDTIISGNTANRAGGGIEIVDGILALTNTDLLNNDAGGAAPAPGNGGGLHVSGMNTTRVTLFGGTVSGNTAASEGGGLWNQSGSIMVIRDGTTISGNTASGNASDNGGGGLFNNGGRLAITSATISGNVADGTEGAGGGILSIGGGLSVDNSTVSGNSANGNGGGITSNGELVTANATIVSNRSDADGVGGGVGGGVFNGGIATLRNTIVAGNIAGTGSTINDIGGNVLQPASTFNLVSDAGSSGGLVDNTNGNIVGNNGAGFIPLAAVVGSLADNGGLTLTHTLAMNSPAIDAGNNAFARGTSGIMFTTDQRGVGFPRVKNGTVDMGAFEV